MIYLKRNIVNNVVYTANEMLNTSASTFVIELENQQSLVKTIANIENVTLNVERYDMSYIIIPTGTTGVSYSGTTTYISGLLSGFYNYTISYNNVILETGKCLIEDTTIKSVQYEPKIISYVYGSK